VPAARGTHCGHCGNPAADKVAYSFTESFILCVVCVENFGLEPKPSKRYLASLKGRRPRGARRRRR
jgi:hypothetical protein